MRSGRTAWLAHMGRMGLCLMATGCSLLFRSEPAQCTQDADCAARGAAFEGYLCQAGRCEASDDDAGPVVRTPDAGLAGCSSNADCPIASAQHIEVVCETETRTCLQLTTDACPFVVGDWQTDNPLVLGAFAFIPTTSAQNHPSTLNYTLAVEELGASGGLPVGSGTLRTPVVVVCDSTAIEPGLAHLVDELKVPGLVATFDSKTLRTEFSKKLQVSRTLTISPYGADSTLTSLQDDGLLWHMLGEPSDLVPTYTSLIKLVEPYARNKLEVGSSPLRVATISGDSTVETDLAESVVAGLTWNDQSIADNTAQGHYLNVALPSTLSGNKLDDIDVDPAVQALLAFKPDVVVSFASEQFTKLVQVLEILWPASAGPRPFYVLSPYNTTDKAFLSWVGGGSNDEALLRLSRVAGVNVAATAEARVLEAYERRFLGRFPMAETALGQENYYDAMYFLVYAAVGAGKVPTLSGDNLREGMGRLLSGTSYDMGPKDVGNVLGALGAPRGSISLFGTLGSPTFNLGSGARRSEGSVYCIALEGVKNPVYKYDVLRLDTESSPLASDAGAPVPAKLVGSFPCYEGLSP